MLTVLDLFSGIGGFSVGLERAGLKTLAFCEVDPRARRVLLKHWPHVPIYEDITKMELGELRPDVICGGFPCQDLSLSGARVGLEGAKSRLFYEMLRLISEGRPKYAIFENVPYLLSSKSGADFRAVLRALAGIGYDAEWDCIAAHEVGKPHNRSRLWVVAYPNGHRQSLSSLFAEVEGFLVSDLGADNHGAPNYAGARIGNERSIRHRANTENGVDDGLRPRVDRDRIELIGNSLVPDIPYLIGRAILKREALEQGLTRTP